MPKFWVNAWLQFNNIGFPSIVILWLLMTTFWTLLSRNYILKMVVKIYRVPLDRFCSNLQSLCKKVLSSKPGELFWKKVLLSFYLQKTDEKWGQNFQKNFQHLQFPWKSFPLIAIRIMPLKTIDLWMTGIQWGLPKGTYSHLYYHTIYHSFSHLSNSFSVAFLYYLIILLRMKSIITYKQNNISVY